MSDENKRFTDYAFGPEIMRDIQAAGYLVPTPIQAALISPALEGKDLIGVAQTGTGKTAAFALPVIQRTAGRAEMISLVLAPTRELARQTTEMFEMLGRSSGIRVATLMGGVAYEVDKKALASWPNVLVATPGRLIDHIESGSVALDQIEVLVVDEADRMHDMGFVPQVRRILAALPPERQTLMMTATMPDDIEDIVRRCMKDAVRIQVGRTSAPAERAAQQLFTVGEGEKDRLLFSLIKESEGRVLVFVRTKRSVNRVARIVSGRVRGVASIHSGRTQEERDNAMSGFRDGTHRILIATDIAARGLDVADIEHVINYDFPLSAEDYVHRIGRTARAAATGKASSFAVASDRHLVVAVERLIGEKLPITAPPAFQPRPAARGRRRPQHPSGPKRRSPQSR